MAQTPEAAIGNAQLKSISKARFDALAGYCRSPKIAYLAKELRWFESADGRVLATLIQDSDGEFSGIILARDEKERFRFVAITGFLSSPEEALVATRGKALEILPKLDEEGKQGDTKGPPVDFFFPLKPDKLLHPNFTALVTKEEFSTAREIIEPMMRWHHDADGNFVEQFQTTAFDARLWELYLFATMVEAGYVLDSDQKVPDLVATGLLGEICLEATTTNPTLNSAGAVTDLPPRETQEERLAYRRDYLPIKYSGPLTAKLKKRYWELPHVRDKPLVFAIQDFHSSGSMTWSRSALPTYLYGFDHDSSRDEDGSLRITPQKVTTHRWGKKEILSGFFNLPGANNISAVLFNNSGTISKFNRMGMVAGFGSDQVTLVRKGFVVDHDPNASEPKEFSRVVNDADYTESWIEGMDVFHNPLANHPLDPDMLPGAAHHHLNVDGLVQSRTPEWQPLSSVTMCFRNS